MQRDSNTFGKLHHRGCILGSQVSDGATDARLDDRGLDGLDWRNGRSCCNNASQGASSHIAELLVDLRDNERVGTGTET